MISAQQLDALDPQTRQAVQALLAQLQHHGAELAFKQALIDKLTHDNAILKRMKFAATSERFASTLAPEHRSLLEETLDTDIAELEREIEREQAGGNKDKTEKKAPKRTPLPPHLPRHDMAHEPADPTCQTPGCGQPMQRFGEDVAERLDYQPGVFSVERQVAVPLLRAHRSGAGAGARHRQGHPDGRLAGAPAGGEVHGSPAAVPAGSHLRARGPPDRPIDAGAVGG